MKSCSIMFYPVLFISLLTWNMQNGSRTNKGLTAVLQVHILPKNLYKPYLTLRYSLAAHSSADLALQSFHHHNMDYPR